MLLLFVNLMIIMREDANLIHWQFYLYGISVTFSHQMAYFGNEKTVKTKIMLLFWISCFFFLYKNHEKKRLLSTLFKSNYGPKFMEIFFYRIYIYDVDIWYIVIHLKWNRRWILNKFFKFHFELVWLLKCSSMLINRTLFNI